MWEWLNALSDSSTRALACEGYRRTHADPTIEVVAFHTELIAAALELYRTREDKNWSLTDCMSFAVMKRRGLKEALTLPPPGLGPQYHVHYVARPERRRAIRGTR